MLINFEIINLFIYYATLLIKYINATIIKLIQTLKYTFYKCINQTKLILNYKKIYYNKYLYKLNFIKNIIKIILLLSKIFSLSIMD